MVRLGILLYGGLDDRVVKTNTVLEIKSKIISLNKIKKGDCVGYGKKFVATKDMEIATIPIGYADGIFRSYGKNGFVIINNHNCKIVGTICMDMLMADVTGINSKVGDEVALIGENLSLKTFADNCGTISYEILTSIKKSRFNVKIE